MTGIALFTLLSLLASPARDSVYGTVRDAVSGTPLAGVRVEIETDGPRGLTQADGAYGLPVGLRGPQVLSLRRDRYNSLRLSLTIPVGTSLRVDVELEPIARPLPPLEVAAVSSHPQYLDSEQSDIGFRRFATNTLSSNPLFMGDDPLLAAEASQDAAAGGDSPSSLRVHGGSSDQNLVLLEGLPVYGLMHVGGVASLFDPDAVESIDLNSSVQPADLGGRLSGAVNVHLRQPDPSGFRLSGAWNPIAIRQLAEGSTAGGAASILLSGRQSYRGVFAQDGDGMLGNEFNDILGRGSLSLGKSEIQLYLLKGSDRLGFPATIQQSTADQVQLPEGPRNQFLWSSQTTGAAWTYSPRQGAVLTTRSWLASSAAGIDWASPRESDRVASELQEFGVSSELRLSERSSQHKMGVSFQRPYTEYQVSPLASTGAIQDAGTLHLQSAPIILAAFAEERRKLGTRWMISAGLRANSVNASDLTLEPRLSIRYHPTPMVDFLAGAARVHQYVQSMWNEESLLDHAVGGNLPVTVGMPGIRPARSDEISGEIRARVDRHANISLNGYARRFSGLLIPAAVSATPFASEVAPPGSGHAGGIEIDARYERGKLGLRASLGTADSRRSADSLQFSPAALRSRWVAVGVVRRIGENALIRVASTLTSGHPTSLVAGDLEWQSPGGLTASGEIAGSPEETLGSLNGQRLPAYFRTDLGLMRHWRVAAAGRDGMLISSITITNLFNRRNLLGYYVSTASAVRQELLYPRRSVAVQLGWRF